MSLKELTAVIHTSSRHIIGADRIYEVNNHCAGANGHNPRANIYIIESIILYIEDYDASLLQLMIDEQYPSHTHIRIHIHIHMHI